MGKKKVIKQTEEQVLKETEKAEKAQKKVKQVKSARNLTRALAFVHSSYNNTIVTLTDEKGEVLTWCSAGSLGFKGPKKSTPYAASRVAEALAEKVQKMGIKSLRVFVRGIGSGRESAVRGLAAAGFAIDSIKDVTPMPHNGCRPPKPRRV